MTVQVTMLSGQAVDFECNDHEVEGGVLFLYRGETEERPAAAIKEWLMYEVVPDRPVT